MYATDIEYAEEKLSDYKMIVCKFNNSGGLETVSSGADITFNQVKPSSSNKFYICSSKYESVFTSVFQICKNPCLTKTQNDKIFTVEEVSAIQRWLCRKDEYHRFKIEQNGFEHIYWNATFSSKQIELNGQIIGLEVTLYTDAPFAYMDEVSAEYNCLADTSFNFYDNSDEIGYILPSMQITFLSDGVFRLKNSLDNEIMEIYNCSTEEIINIDGKNQIITSSNSSHNFSNNFNFLFPKIINSYDERCNVFTPSLDCKIVITYSPIKKVGL